MWALVACVEDALLALQARKGRVDLLPGIIEVPPQRIFRYVRVPAQDAIQNCGMGFEVSAVAVGQARHLLPMGGQPGGIGLVQCRKDRISGDCVENAVKGHISLVKEFRITDRLAIPQYDA